jgi:hypothetical protein
MTRTRGWNRCGDRLVARAPHDHWKTTTLLAALRRDRIDCLVPNYTDWQFDAAFLDVYDALCFSAFQQYSLRRPPEGGAKIASFDILAPSPSKSVSAKVTEGTYVSGYSNLSAAVCARGVKRITEKSGVFA